MIHNSMFLFVALSALVQLSLQDPLGGGAGTGGGYSSGKSYSGSSLSSSSGSSFSSSSKGSSDSSSEPKYVIIHSGRGSKRTFDLMLLTVRYCR